TTPSPASACPHCPAPTWWACAYRLPSPWTHRPACWPATPPARKWSTKPPACSMSACAARIPRGPPPPTRYGSRSAGSAWPGCAAPGPAGCPATPPPGRCAYPSPCTPPTRPPAVPHAHAPLSPRGDPRHDHATHANCAARVLSGIEDADEGGVEDADVVRQGRPAGGVPARRWSVRCRWLWARCRCLVDDFADGGAGGGFVDEVLAGGERGDEGLQGQVVDRAGVAAGGG